MTITKGHCHTLRATRSNCHFAKLKTEASLKDQDTRIPEALFGKGASRPTTSTVYLGKKTFGAPAKGELTYVRDGSHEIERNSHVGDMNTLNKELKNNANLTSRDRNARRLMNS